MNTIQVENILRADCKLSSIFEGVFPSDRLPAFCDENKTAMVMNLDPHDQAGSHWVCLYIENGHGEYFDSYGESPPVKNFVSFIKRNCTSWNFNRNELQSLNTDVCGDYCIWFLSERARGKSMQDIVSQFSNDCKNNDIMVRKQVTSRYGDIVAQVLSKTNIHLQGCYKRKCRF